MDPIDSKVYLVIKLLEKICNIFNRASTALQLQNGIIGEEDHISEASGANITQLEEIFSLLTPSDRNIFVTLHYLLPSTFIPALDLLDRGQVDWLQLEDEADNGDSEKNNTQQDTCSSSIDHATSALSISGPAFLVHDERSIFKVLGPLWTCICPQYIQNTITIGQVAEKLPLCGGNSVSTARLGAFENLDTDFYDKWFLKVGQCRHVVACFVVFKSGRSGMFGKRARHVKLSQEQWIRSLM
ncbi:hypothetical protein V1511DRAFT_387100 [Dipodascopsis uninucleata]